MKKTFLSYQLFKRTSPLMQALWVLGIGTLAMFIGSLVSDDEETVWFFASTTLGFYALLNAVISFFVVKKWVKYFFQSIVLFLLLSFVLYTIASSLSQIDAKNLYEYRMLYSVTVAFYILGSLVVTLMKNIAQALQIDY